MLDHEYRKKNAKYLKRSWLFTIMCGLFFVLTVWWVVFISRYFGHDPLIVFTVTIPSAFIAVVFLFAALNGRKDVVKEAINSVMTLAIWWN